MSLSLSRRAALEALGTALLIATAVGAGVMAQRLGAGSALGLLAAALTTAGILVAIIMTLGPWSGAHFNPVVSLTQGMPRNEALVYVAAQVAGAVLGVFAVHLMFGLEVLQSGASPRAGTGQVFGEFIATFGLVLLVSLSSAKKQPPEFVAFAVAGYIGAAYWFTSSTSFANPAGTLARALTSTPAGIRPADVPGFLLGEFAGAAAAFALARWLVGKKAP